MKTKILWMAVVAAGTCLAQRPAPPPPIISPEISANHDVTFRLRAPNAEQVQLASGGDFPASATAAGFALTKNESGVWELTMPALASGGYRYNFNVDGVSTADPSNPDVSQSNGSAWSLVYVPGSAFMDAQNVLHGAVAEVSYPSSVMGRTRRMHVYTPPGYQKGKGDYPVFYLLHGAQDGDDSWSSVGRAGFILDNLIASGQAKPMIVVMPDGHTNRLNQGGARLPVDEFALEFAADIKPYIESNYRVQTGRNNTAIAGLSMGGAQTLEIAIRNLDKYGYVGVFSSGVFSIAQDKSWQTNYDAALHNASLKKGLKLVWFSTGSDDFLLGTTKATVDMLRESGFDVTFEESTGGHTWINWRQYLNKFAPQLFR